MAWLLADGPRLFLDDAWFAIEVLALTLVTRGIGAATAVSALAWCIALVAPLTLTAGALLETAGVEVTSGAGNSGIVPLVEEALKLLPIPIVATVVRRRSPWLLNASDLLLLGVMSGAGVSLVESSYFDHVRTGARYGPSIGPLALFPAAWGTAGYIGHEDVHEVDAWIEAHDPLVQMNKEMSEKYGYPYTYTPPYRR